MKVLDSNFINDESFINLTDHDKTLYLLRLDNDKTSHVIAKYAHPGSEINFLIRAPTGDQV